MPLLVLVSSAAKIQILFTMARFRELVRQHEVILTFLELHQQGGGEGAQLHSYWTRKKATERYQAYRSSNFCSLRHNYLISLDLTTKTWQDLSASQMRSPF